MDRRQCESPTPVQWLLTDRADDATTGADARDADLLTRAQWLACNRRHRRLPARDVCNVHLKTALHSRRPDAADARRTGADRDARLVSRRYDGLVGGAGARGRRREPFDDVAICGGAATGAPSSRRGLAGPKLGSRRWKSGGGV